MSVEAALLIGLGLFLGPVVSNWMASRRPKDIVVSVQKTTNSATQPEIVTGQISLPAAADEEAVFEAMDKLGFAATCRMTTVNEMILRENARIAESIAAKRPAKVDKWLAKLDNKKKKYIARKLGIPIDEVTDEQVQAIVGKVNRGEVEREVQAEAE